MSKTDVLQIIWSNCSEVNQIIVLFTIIIINNNNNVPLIQYISSEDLKVICTHE